MDRNAPRVALGVLLVWCAGGAHATPANKAAMARHYDRFMAGSLNACTTCHLPSAVKSPETLEEFPHNPFGARLREAGKAGSIGDRLAAVAREDADGDGVDNETELLLGSAPGDAKDRPGDTQLAKADALKAEWARFSSGYRWRPFEKVVRPAVPGATDAAWARNPIDAFVAEQREARGLKPRPEASKEVLLRRIYIDLIGLNPTPDEVKSFLADPSPDAYEKLVDRLLVDPRHGERWGRHWMDVWRYSDWAGWTDGGQVRDSHPHVWRWRDWIVRSLNEDRPYDEMVRLMLAGDELAPEDPQALAATGFLVRNYKKLSREQWLEDTLNHTTRAFLGLSLHCAKCHDHMHDPVTQQDYYNLRAVFEPHEVRVDRVPGEADPKMDGLSRAYDAKPDAATFYYVRGDERRPDRERKVVPAVPRFLGAMPTTRPVGLPFAVAHPDRREFVRVDLTKQSEATVETARKKYKPVKDDDKRTARERGEAEAQLAAAEAKHRALVAVLAAERLEDAGKKGTDEWKAAGTEAWRAQRAAAVADASVALLTAQNAVESGRAKAGTNLKPLQDKVDAAVKALAAATNALNDPPSAAYKARSTDDYPDRSTGRRTAFAAWLTDDDNPLTARVAVNHIWLRHMGSALVPSVADFGGNGRPATHPALLDWLASEFVRSGWSMRHVHRLIVTSSTYRMSATPDVGSAAIDPDNAWLWRMNSRRLEAEAVRDNLIWVAGHLDATMGGPEIPHTQGLTSPRRSIYLRSAPEKEVEFLKIFDGPGMDECYERKRSVMPQQALALANSELAVAMGKKLAGSIAATGPEAFVNELFVRTVTRRPTAGELATCLAFLGKGDGTRARENLALVMLNHNDFLTVR